MRFRGGRFPRGPQVIRNTQMKMAMMMRRENTNKSASKHLDINFDNKIWLAATLLFKCNTNDIDGILKFFEFTLTTQCRLSAGERETLPFWFLPLENLNGVQGFGSLFINWIYVILCCSNILLVYSLEKYIYRYTFYLENSGIYLPYYWWNLFRWQTLHPTSGCWVLGLLYMNILGLGSSYGLGRAPRFLCMDRAGESKWFLFDAQKYSLTEPLQICDKMTVADDGKSFSKKSWYGNLEVVGVHGMTLSKECCPTQK